MKKRSSHGQTHQKSKKKNTADLKKPARVEGVISTTGKGTGFLEHESLKEDVLIENKFLHTALNGDEVDILLLPKITGERQQGEVVNIIRRAKWQFVGTLEKSNGGFFLVPDDKKMYVDIYIPHAENAPTHESTKALVEITEWPKHLTNPQGKILRIIGVKGSHEVEIQSIILERGIDTNFPDEVLREAKEIEKGGTPLSREEMSRRKDMRAVRTFTIDPANAKDFDDAISMRELSDGTYEISIHIADVSHYVREGTALDREARHRAFSVYLVDRTIPMLPEALSNDLCSINPDEDRFAFSTIVTITRAGEVTSRWFGKTVIHSQKRFSYEDAQHVINAGRGEWSHELLLLNRLAKILREKKMKAGAIDFEQDEVKFELDSSGKPIRVFKKERLDTHKLVEEFMLLANREVAEYIATRHSKRHSLYRIHDLPDRERLIQLSFLLKALGHDIKIPAKISAKDVSAILKKVEGKAEESLVKTATLRTMAKAIYSTKNIGHFGLGFEYYTHFTSPIRRYPDLIVHRILENLLSGNQQKFEGELRELEDIAANSTDKEIAAAEAERASIKYKQVEYMAEKVGQTFVGTISGVTEWGIYIEERETRAEGMVRLRDMNDDYYELNEKTYTIKGSKTGKKYTLGDTVRVKLLRADLDTKSLDFAFLQ